MQKASFLKPQILQQIKNQNNKRNAFILHYQS